MLLHVINLFSTVKMVLANTGEGKHFSTEGHGLYSGNSFISMTVSCGLWLYFMS